MSSCRFERDVLAGRWTDALRAHVATCDDCTMTMQVAPWMSDFARMPDREHMLPDPAVLFLKAQLMRGTVDAARLSRPLTVVQMLAYGLVAAAWAALLTWKWESIVNWLHPGLNTFAGTGSVSLTFFAMVLVLGTATVMLAVHTILAEE